MRMIDVNDKYQIYTELCTPSTFENGTDVVEFVVHGCVGFAVDVISLSDDNITLLESGLIIHIGTLAGMGLRTIMSNQL